MRNGMLPANMEDTKIFLQNTYEKRGFSGKTAGFLHRGNGGIAPAEKSVLHFAILSAKMNPNFFQEV